MGKLVIDNFGLFFCVQKNKFLYFLTVCPFYFLQRLKKDILDDLTKLGKDAGLASFEQVNFLFFFRNI